MKYVFSIISISILVFFSSCLPEDGEGASIVIPIDNEGAPTENGDIVPLVYDFGDYFEVTGVDEKITILDTIRSNSRLVKVIIEDQADVRQRRNQLTFEPFSLYKNGEENVPEAVFNDLDLEVEIRADYNNNIELRNVGNNYLIFVAEEGAFRNQVYMKVVINEVVISEFLVYLTRPLALVITVDP